MNNGLNTQFKYWISSTLALLISCFLILSPFGDAANASRSLMKGNYQEDTISVIHSLEETIALAPDTENRSDLEQEAVDLITDYISRYRNRSQINGTLSYTTMQTALNAMAGHYKTFANRPLPEKLKERLNKELTEAEKLVTSDR